MVAVRNAHFHQTDSFDLNYWVSIVGFSNPQCSERITEIWRYYEQQCQHHPKYSLLLCRSIEMVEILSMLSMDSDSLCAALLFPLVDTKIVKDAALELKFGTKIAALVHGVRNITTAIRQLSVVFNHYIAPAKLDNVLSIVEDWRCIVIKLAERITKLRELKNAHNNKQLLAATESINIYAPLANRLRISQLTWELEDLCFRYLHIAEYKRIAKLLHERRRDRELYINNFVCSLRQSMQEEGLKAEIYGRPKHIYSIWRKMQSKMLAFDELFDVRAVRVIVDRLQDCYTALGIAHNKFMYLPNEFDDYINNPKPNGYQSIHTVVLGPYSKTLEIQIRTYHMHEHAELGIAAHWKYKVP